jgi:ATP-dependent DNA helicase RecQ
MHFDSDRALELLRVGAEDPTATFRDGQSEAVQHIVEGKGRLLVSSLLALMRNQAVAAERMGVRAETILIREAGAGPVWPVALAYTGHD